MGALYRHDLAYIQAVGFGDFARGAAPEIVRVLRSAAIPMRRVIDIGCGAGPMAAALMDGGFEATGIDVSAELLSLARIVCPGARFIHGSIYEREIPACEAMVAIGEPLTYHDGGDADARVRDFFRRAHDALPAGGMLIFECHRIGRTFVICPHVEIRRRLGYLGEHIGGGEFSDSGSGDRNVPEGR